MSGEVDDDDVTVTLSYQISLSCVVGLSYGVLSSSAFADDSAYITTKGWCTLDAHQLCCLALLRVQSAIL